MTELAVRFRYSHGVHNALSMIVRLLFPVWGIAAPAAVVIGLIICLFNPTYMLASPILAITIASAALALISLRVTKLLDREFLIADKSGIDLPGNFAGSLVTRRVSWDAVQKIEVMPGSHPEKIADAQLAFFVHNNRAVVLQCHRFTTTELEQLLLAIQLWAPPEAMGQGVLQLQETIKSTALIEGRETHDPSYTALWEEELSRRFRNVAFLPLEPGAVVRNGSLKVVRQLAMGGLAAVYLCQLDNRDFVVVKEAVIPDGSSAELKSKAQELFHREAQLLMKLEHPHVVKVLDCFVEDGRNYLMLDYVNGISLRQYVNQNGRLRETVALDWATQIASVLVYLHAQNPPIIHRDLTPDNFVVRNDGQVVVIDFGAANEFIGNSTGTFVGKQCYIPPEQFRGKATPQSDLYAFGGTLYFLLTGEDPEALSAAHPAQKNPSVSEETDALVAQCMEPESQMRIATAETVLKRLKLTASTAS